MYRGSTMKSGVYIIKNIVNNKVYIGSAIDIKKRWWRHKKDLRKGKHHSKLLLRAWNKYEEQNFKFEILQEVSNPEHLLSYEQVYLDYYKSYENDRGYNICKTAGSQYGLKRTEETKRKISDAVSGENAPFRGRKHKPETIEYLRRINTGKKVSEETKQKLRDKLSGENAPNYGKKFSEETKRKIGEASSKRRHTEETKKKMKEKRAGRKHSQETKDKMSKTRRCIGKGYTYNKDNKKYRVRMWINGVKKHIGYFLTEEEAIQAVLINSNKNRDGI
jgi:group I intron endonuclease